MLYGDAQVTKRARSSSILSVTEIEPNYEDSLDQSSLNNVNADWVNLKGQLLRTPPPPREREGRGHAEAGERADRGRVGAAGSWLIHVFFCLLGKVLVDIIPGMTTDFSWTFVTLGYLFVRPPPLLRPA